MEWPCFNEPMRLVLALKVPPLETHLSQLQELKDNLQSRHIDASWISHLDLYIPLIELGEHGRASFLKILEGLQKMENQIFPFSLDLSGFVGHPSLHETERISIGVKTSNELTHLHDYLSHVLAIDSEHFLRPELPLLYLDKKENCMDLLVPYQRIDFGRVNINEIQILEREKEGHDAHLVSTHLLSSREDFQWPD